MTYSAKLNRHISVAVELLNNFDWAEFEAATARLYDDSPEEIRRKAQTGSYDASLLLELAAGNGELADAARDFVG